MADPYRRLEINGGRVVNGDTVRLVLPAQISAYTDAQIDDYGGRKRREYLWRQGTSLELSARFSDPAGQLKGTAGFGFWNAPFGDPSVRWPALPKAAWFFYASNHSDLPLRVKGAGHGWFTSTIDATGWDALLLAPLAPLIIVLNNFGLLRGAIWPFVRKHLKISFEEVPAEIDHWHRYRLNWSRDRCRFWLDERIIHETELTPRSPLGFVCWIDNQYLVATPEGKFKWVSLPLDKQQWLEISDLSLSATSVDI